MSEIKDKIAKLLALADSPNENEARAALLKARKLMAEHKLRPDDCQQAADQSVRRELVGVSCSKIKNAWAVTLSVIIAHNYCCKAFRRHQKGGKRVSIGFVGLEEDIAICKGVFRYAFHFVDAECAKIVAPWRGRDGRYGRRLAESYGFGFCRGVEEALKKQTEQQQWGLVMTVPQAVLDSMKDMGKGAAYGCLKHGTEEDQYYRQGYQEGTRFDPRDKLPDPEKPPTEEEAPTVEKD